MCFNNPAVSAPPMLTKTDNTVLIVSLLEIMYVAKIPRQIFICPGMRNDFWAAFATSVVFFSPEYIHLYYMSHKNCMEKLII